MRHGLAGYLVRRMVQAVFIVACILLLNFAILQLAPGDAVDVLAGEFGAASPEFLAELRRAYGLDQPVYVQLASYVWNILQLNLGWSFRNSMPVSELIMSRLPATLILMTTAMAMSCLLGMLLGIVSARNVNGIADNIISVIALLFYATPLFWFGLMAIVLFTVQLGWLPASGMRTIGGPGGWAGMLDLARHLAMPALTLALFHIAVYTRLVRASMLEVYGLDYIRTARAKGLSARRVALRHVVPNAMLPMVTMLGLQMGSLLGGAVMVETVFGWPGLGRLAFDAVFQRDFNLLLGILMLSSILVVVINLLTDLTYAWLDPRIEVDA